jgi:hypothetical protein
MNQMAEDENFMWHVGKIKRDSHRCLVRKPEEKRLIGRTRSKLEDNIKTDLTEMV